MNNTKNFKDKYKFTKGVYVPKKKPNNYAKNFGYQWRDFSKTQIDYFNKTNISGHRAHIATFGDKNTVEVTAELRIYQFLKLKCAKIFLSKYALESGP